MTPPTNGLRPCTKCGHEKCWPASFGKPRLRECKTCMAERADAWRKATLEDERRGAALLKRKREEARLHRRRQRRERLTRQDRHVGPLERTVAELVPLWGPYARWTREQHARHSEILRKLAGIADAPTRGESEDRAA